MKASSFGRWLHVPAPLFILGTGTWIGDYTCDHDLFIFMTLLFLTPFAFLFLLLAAGSTAVVALGAKPGRRAREALFHGLILGIAVCLLPTTLTLGRWTWEQRVLSPRVAELQRFVPPSSLERQPHVTIAGYTFNRFEQAPEGKLYYTLELGGHVASRGIFVPKAYEKRESAPLLVEPPAIVRSVTPTSIAGLFWFFTND